MINLLKKSIIGLIIAFIVYSVFCYFYDTKSGIFLRENAATPWIFEPGCGFYYMKEGAGHVYIDENGYPNKNKELAESYVLMLGPSYLEGDQIRSEDNVSAVLDSMYGGELSHVYNMGLDGNFFCSTVKGFKAAMEEFPNADAVVILLQLDYPDDLNDVLNQEEYSKYSTGKYLMQSQTEFTKLKKNIGKFSPGIKQIKYRINLYLEDIVNNIGHNNSVVAYQDEVDRVRSSYASMLCQIRHNTNVPIIIVHFPLSHLSDEGIEYDDKWEYLPIFKEECVNNGIDFLSVEDAFYEAYENEYIIPYGFINSEIGSGHLNKYGHRILAEEIYKVLIKKGIQYK